MNNSMPAGLSAPMPPLNERLLAALNRLESCVNRTEAVLARLRDTGPEVTGAPSAPVPTGLPAHEIVDRIEGNLNKIETRIDNTLSLL